MGTVRDILERLEEASTVDPQVQAIVTEYMRLLPPGLPRPDIKYVDRITANWLGQCKYAIGAPTTTIYIQRGVIGDVQTLRRIVAHELCHHAIDLAGWREAEERGLSKKDFVRQARAVPDAGHGGEFKHYAELFNARYGAGFVTSRSDETYVQAEASRDVTVLLWMQGARLLYAYAVRLGPKQRKYLARLAERYDAAQYRLATTRDPSITAGARIGEGFSLPSLPERVELMSKLWASGKALEGTE